MNLDFPVIGIVAILTGLIVQFLAKPLIEVWVKPEDTNHNTIIQATALLLGVVLTCVDVLIGHPLPSDGNGYLLLIGSGVMSGLGSIGGYHALTGSATPANAVTVIPPTKLPEEVLAHVLQQAQPAPKVAPSTPEPHVSLSGDGSSGVGTGTNVITYATPEVTGGEAAAGKPA